MFNFFLLTMVAGPFYISISIAQGGFQYNMISKHFLEFCELPVIKSIVSFDIQSF